MKRVIDTNIFRLPNSHMLHIATIGEGPHEYVLMLDPNTSLLYLEEVSLNTSNLVDKVWANFKQITDDALFEDLMAFISAHKLDDAKRIADIVIDMGKQKWIAT